MSKARDISNLFSASTSAATDAEVTSAISTHASNTTNRHYKVGDTNSRPGSPSVGDLYFDTTLDGFVQYTGYNGWILIGSVGQPPSIVTGGTLSSDSTYYYRTFTSSGTLSISQTNLTSDILMVAGGGGSGYDAGGGGGAGGLIIANNKSLTIGSYAITIGAGGVYQNLARGTSGTDTTGFSWTAIGGGGGGYYSSPQSGINGGSGGGGVSSSGAGGLGQQQSGSGYTGYGNNGGSGSSSFNSGGGGGAGGVGGDAGGPGGLPLYSTIFNNTGASIAYSGGGYGNSDGGGINDTGYDQSNTYIGYYGFGANGQGNQAQLNSNKNGNPGVVIIRYLKSQAA